MKNRLILIFSILIIIMAFFIIKNNFSLYNKKHEIVYNKNESFLKSQEIEGITFDKIECYFDGNESLISYTITNKTNNTIELNNYELLVKDNDNNTLTNIVINSNLTLEPNTEKTVRNRVIGKDLSNAKSIELKTNIKK